MECCVGVSTETCLKIDKIYTIVRRILEPAFWTVVLHQSECHTEMLEIQSKGSTNNEYLFTQNDLKQFDNKQFWHFLL